MKPKERHYKEDPIQTESASYAGLSFPCSCGDCFQNGEDLDNHIEAMKPYAIRFWTKSDYLMHWYFWLLGFIWSIKIFWGLIVDFVHWAVK